MTYDAKKLCKKLGDNYFEIDPEVMFPATIARIKEVLAGDPPVELVKEAKGIPWFNPAVKQFYDDAMAIPGGDWDVPTPGVLALAESWFKRALALKVGKGIRLHITKNLKYKR